MANQALLYDTYMDYYKRAMAAKKAGEIAVARKFFLLSAETLQQLALQSDGELKKARYETVKKLIAAANSLSENVARNGSQEQRAPIDENSDEFDLEIASPNDFVAFSDIIGLEKAKEAIHRMLINPLANPEAYKRYNLAAGGNILLEGPPGTGKTTFAKAAACEIKLPFVIANCNALVDCLIGNTGKNIDRLFSEVRRLVRRKKTAVILFCDEFDAIAKSRTSDDKTAAEAVPSLIRQLDGFDTDNKSIVIIAATNIKETLDKAILSRFGKTIYIPLPSEDERKQIFISKFNKGKLMDKDKADIDFLRVAKGSEGLSGRDINNIALDFLNIMAERDCGMTTLKSSLTDILLELVKQKKS